jgi:hypothetical protein
VNVNLKGAARNAYDGITAICEFIDSDARGFDNVEDLVDALEEILFKYQPRLAAYCLREHFDAQHPDAEKL